ncbi:PREDICTED: importin-9-like [Amphimedon queenslandica]|uniref:Importin N-terminal domain-containing protein n=1 Tax=Amphimedon queenslandica TaxID=400682 RepID=A0A1X7VW59_AMPQE|nr:PREDICTED: importin-9-like [Amphimedon queenslandica]|eukprot:XP_019850616.1 PREDICTED: importin-9-like [Amphimedon queenslandica]
MAGHTSQEKEALRSVVLSSFSTILSGDQQERKNAEEELRALEVTEGFGLVLVEITLMTDGPIACRQLASVILKQYVKSHWSEESGEYSVPPSEDAKSVIRELLLRGLADPLSKIRATVAYAVSAIAQHDWPENWPNLFDQLMVGVGSGSPDLVHGTMRVLTEFCQEITDTQVPHVCPVILPQLLRVIGSPQVYSIRTRSRAISIFRTLSQLIYAMSAHLPEAPLSLLFPVLPSYIEQFVQLLNSNDEFSSDPGLRKEIITSLSKLLEWFPSLLRPHQMTIVTPIWNVLISSSELYNTNVVKCSDGSIDVYDSDGEIINFDSVLFAIFRFIAILLECGRHPQLFLPIIHKLVDLLTSLMQITSEQVILWENDVSRYLEDDDNELAFSVRLGAFELLQQLSEDTNLRSSVCEAINNTIERNLTQDSSGDWWKIREACLWIVGSIIIDGKKQSVGFNGEVFVDNVLIPNLMSSVSPFLTGRCLWLAGKMCDQLNSETLNKCLQATVSGLQPSQNGIVRIMAAKSCYSYCMLLKESDRHSVVVPYLSYFINDICTISSESHEDHLFIALDSLQKVCQFDDRVTAVHAEKLVPLSLSLFLKFSHDPMTSSCLEELFACLAANVGCHALLHSRIVPVAIELLSATESQVPLGMISAVLDILVVVIRGCVPPLPPPFLDELFKVVVRKILVSEDSAILQSGGECVRAYLSVASDQLITWVDESGQSGLHYAAQVVIHLLDPARPEYSAAFIDKLIIVFIKKVGAALGSYLELVLRSVLSKMQQAQAESVMQSLLIVFAHLASSQQLEGLLTFLSQVPDPSGRPALEYVITEWCARHSCFFGSYEQRLSTIALCQLLSHCINTGDQRLNSIAVVEEEIPLTSDGIVTRSKKVSAGQSWTRVPLPAKLLKVLIGELQSQIEGSEEEDNGDDEDPWSGGGGREEGEDDEGGDDMINDLEVLLGDVGTIGLEEEEEDDDPDLKDEELLKIDLHSHLVHYLTELSYQPCFPSLLHHLSPYEKQTLGAVGAITSVSN